MSKVKKNILKIIKNSETFKNIPNLNNDIKQRLFYIIKIFTGSSFYYKKHEHNFEIYKNIKKETNPSSKVNPLSSTSYKNKDSHTYKGSSMMDNSQNEGVKKI